MAVAGHRAGGGRAAGAIAAAAVLAVAPVVWAATPANAAKQVFFQAQTTATAVHVTVTQQPASSIITASLIDDAIAYAAGDFESGGSSEALAASAFPGRLVVQGPQLLCSELFSCPFTPPSYPLLADASYPRRANDTAQANGQAMGSGPLVVTPTTAHAHAVADGNSAATSAGAASLLAGTPGAIAIGASAATSTVSGTSDALRVHLESVLTDVTIGGVVHVAKLRAVDDIEVRPGQKPVDHPTITVIGVTAGGQSATIDQDGIHVAGNDGPSVSQRLSQAGVSISTVGTHHDDTANGARSDATALEVGVAIPVSGVPYIPNPLPTLPPPFDQVPQLPGVNANGTYVAHVTLGAVGAAAGLGEEPTFDLGGFGTIPSPAPPGSQPAVSAAGSANLPGTPTGTGTAPTTATPQLAPRAPGFRGFLDALSAHDIELLYAVLALGSLAMFVGWRGAALLRSGPLAAWRRR